jgi:hypothetical protein
MTHDVSSWRVDASDRQHAVPLHLRRQSWRICSGISGFLGFYIASGLAAAAGQILADPGSSVPMVGASGAIAGVMGGYLLMFPRARIDVLVIIVIPHQDFHDPRMADAWLLVRPATGERPCHGRATGGGVAYWAHAGGFVAGVLLVLPVFLQARRACLLGREPTVNRPTTRLNMSVARSRRSPVPSVRRVRTPRRRGSAAIRSQPRTPFGAAAQPAHAMVGGTDLSPVACTAP